MKILINFLMQNSLHFYFSSKSNANQVLIHIIKQEFNGINIKAKNKKVLSFGCHKESNWTIIR